jgi:hypothetical protein
MTFWLIIVALIIIGIIGASIINSFAGDYDFVTPFLSIIFALAFIAVAIGLVIGRYVF